MNCNEMKEHYKNFQVWLQSLNSVNDNKWFAPIAEGKWSPAAIVSHLLFWDKHSLKDRFPNFKNGAELVAYPDFQQVNDSAREYAHSGVTKEEILNEIIEVRKQYFHFLDLYNDHLTDAFSIGNHSLTIKEYFEDFIGHDLHHQKQIIEAIK